MDTAELSSKERQQLMDVLGEMNGTATERRRDKRRPVTVKLYVRRVKAASHKKITDEVGLFSAIVVDVAAHGVGLQLRHALEAGDKIVLPLRFREGGGWLVLCQVRSCSPAGEGSFRVGAKFLERLDDPEGIAKVPVDWLL
jgi:hypothetical protein